MSSFSGSHSVLCARPLHQAAAGDAGRGGGAGADWKSQPCRDAKESDAKAGKQASAPALFVIMLHQIL